MSQARELPVTYGDVPLSRRAPPSAQVCAGHGDLPTKGTAWECWEGDGAGKTGKAHLGQGVRVTIAVTSHVDGGCS